MNKLNLGCGENIKEGWVNLDSAALPGVDVTHDIEKIPFPFKDGEFDEILCRDVLEHVEYIPTLRELHRILKPGGVLRIQVPHFTSRNNFVDPTHRRMFSISTFDFFAAGTPRFAERAYYFDFSFSKIKSRRITFKRRDIFWFNRIISKIVNSRDALKIFYEETCLARLFPAENIVIELIK